LKWGVQRYHIRTRRELPGILLYSRLDIPYGSDGLYRTETVICVDGENVLRKITSLRSQYLGKIQTLCLKREKYKKERLKESIQGTVQIYREKYALGNAYRDKTCQIVHELMDKGCSKEEINSTLKELFCL